LEIGSGTGLNVVHYPEDLDGLVLTEPEPSMRKRLENAVRRSERRAQVIDAAAEQLPFADATIDTVVSTLVLCTVDAPDVALREVGRVLRPTGSCCSSSMCDPTHRRSPACRNDSPGRGSASPRGAGATAQHSS
jgi:ubiquinone/menaquinone biosynthesis C-methylase UbiE